MAYGDCFIEVCTENLYTVGEYFRILDSIKSLFEIFVAEKNGIKVNIVILACREVKNCTYSIFICGITEHIQILFNVFAGVSVIFEYEIIKQIGKADIGIFHHFCHQPILHCPHSVFNILVGFDINTLNSVFCIHLEVFLNVEEHRKRIIGVLIHIIVPYKKCCIVLS